MSTPDTVELSPYKTRKRVDTSHKLSLGVRAIKSTNSAHAKIHALKKTVVALSERLDRLESILVGDD